MMTKICVLAAAVLLSVCNAAFAADVGDSGNVLLRRNADIMITSDSRFLLECVFNVSDDAPANCNILSERNLPTGFDKYFRWQCDKSHCTIWWGPGESKP